MKITGIVSEFNPLHNGHKYILERAREYGDAVVSVMSGNYTERGEFAIIDKYERAEMAIKCGANLVLELPFPMAMSGAEYFAEGGIAVLNRIGADSVCFGSECGDLKTLESAASAALNPEFSEAYRNKLLDGNAGSAEAYIGLLCEFGGRKFNLSSNDILGVEYIKSIIKHGYKMTPYTVKREGDRFLDEDLGKSEFASATAIRAAILKGDEGVEKYMPREAYDVLLNAIERGDAPVSAEKIDRGILLAVRLLSPEILENVAELGGGLGYRLWEASMIAASVGELVSMVSTKKYTRSRIKRGILYALLGIERDDLKRIDYTLVLGADGKGRKILSSLRNSEGAIKIVTKAADAPMCRQREICDRADALYTTAYDKVKEKGFFTRKRIYLP